MNRTIFITATILGMLAIVLGAFAAHGLKILIPLEAQQTFETGVRYQMYHAFYLFIIGILNTLNDKTKRRIFYLVIIGLIFFSGSIYGLATNTLTSFDFKSIGFITPIGGLLLIISWLILLINFLKISTDKS
ncbi:DUF423 domain-containing protein [Psychroserpens ponticola]|uniref:DUF423 domain-containing protein n=1 Tax=Psychroserpens ponticola TaxID=2932268 RepID=A0ABY7RW70_9FLAO|nr:DUF423 domain-containing protein [Psychroserpens ponticola]WCO01394.1 DUF423 domain-containing protein [Psychroserpens ponticola]